MPRSGAGASGRSQARDFLPREPAPEILLYLRPFVIDDAVVGRVAMLVSAHYHVLAEDAFEPRGERRKCRAGALVARVGLELDPHAMEPLEGVLQHEQLGLDVRARPPARRSEPGPADLQAAVRGPQREIAGAADGLAALGVQGRERGLVSRLRCRQGALHPPAKTLAGFGRVVRSTTRIEWYVPPDPRVLRGLEEALLMTRFQRLQDDQRASEPACEVLPHAFSSHPVCVALRGTA